MTTDKKQKIALVSGANRGIGLAIVTALAGKGVHVLLGCREVVKGESAAAPLIAQGLKVTPVALDVTDDASVTALAAQIDRDYGVLDILVNNAGIALDFAAGMPVADRLKGALEVNVIGLTRLTEAMVPFLAKSGHGRIVNLSSELGSFGRRNDPTWEYADFRLPTYAATKAAVNAMTIGYAKDLAAQGIKVNAVCPGYTATEATAFAGPRKPEQGAAVVANFALLEDDGVTGSFVNEDGELPW